ncbi:NAD(P)-binding domain-containing protein [Streptomyces sp. NBC_01508]
MAARYPAGRQPPSGNRQRTDRVPPAPVGTVRAHRTNRPVRSAEETTGEETPHVGEREPRAVHGVGDRPGTDGDPARRLAQAFLTAGYATTVWNRSAAKADALVAQGAVRAATVEEAVAAGSLVVGAMLAIPETVATSEGFFLYSGAQRAFTTYRRELEVMAPAHYFGTDPGSAEIHDLALLGTGYAALTGFLHAAAVLDPVGTSPEVFAPLAAHGLRDSRVPARTGARGGRSGVCGRSLHGRPQPDRGRQPHRAQQSRRHSHRRP